MSQKTLPWLRRHREWREMTGEEAAHQLCRRLEELERIRKVAAQLLARDQLNRDFFARGCPEPLSDATSEDRLRELFDAYRRVRQLPPRKKPSRRPAAKVAEALPLFFHANEKARR